MAKKAILLLGILSLFTVTASSQSSGHTSNAIPDATFGEIPDSLLKMETYSPDPSAPYIYAYKDVEISFEEDEKSIVATLDYHVRIKVFDGDAKQASIIAIPYYFQDEVESVDQIHGTTYNDNGGRTPLQDDGIRTINLNTRYNIKEFTMPEVKDGSVIEYSYRKKRRFIEELPDFFLAHQAPTALAKATIQYPRYLRYEVVPVDLNGEVRHIEQRIDTSSVPKVFSLPRPDPLVLHHWIARNIPAVDQEAYISSVDDYRGKLKFQLKEFGVPRQQLENSWELAVAQLRKNQNPWEIINRSERARELGTQIGAAFSNPEAAQDSIFRFLNSRSRFSDALGSYSPMPDDSVLSGKVATQPAINQTLVAMLRGAGIDAAPLLISNRQYGKINRSFPSYFQFNGLLVYSDIGGQGYFMDASYPQSSPGLIPVDSFNETGLLLKKESYEWLEVKPENSIFAINTQMEVELDPQGNISGTVVTNHFGYPARLLREQAANGSTPNEILRDVMFDGFSDISLQNVQITNLQQFDDSVQIQAEFHIKGYATSFTDGIDYQPLVVGSLMSNPFSDENRNLPITLDAPEKLNISFQLRLPDGYSLGQGRQNRAVQLSGAELHEHYESAGQVVRYGYQIDISSKQFEPELYPQLLDLYERWVELSNMTWRIKRN